MKCCSFLDKELNELPSSCCMHKNENYKCTRGSTDTYGESCYKIYLDNFNHFKWTILIIVVMSIFVQLFTTSCFYFFFRKNFYKDDELVVA